MIKLIATAESLSQGKQLLDLGVDELIIGEEIFGLRLPGYFTLEEMKEITDYAHQANRKIIVAMNAILHNDKIKAAPIFLKKLKEIDIDKLLVGDTGLIQLLKDVELSFPYIYDAATLVTSAGQVNFWSKFGASSALIVNEVPLVELEKMSPLAEIPLMYQVYGAACIHQSKRHLLHNYFNFINKDTTDLANRDLFLSEPTKKDTHYSIYTDSHGTHIFANKDLNLMEYLEDLNAIGVHDWFLDGLFSNQETFPHIVEAFSQARRLIESNSWNPIEAKRLGEVVTINHPANRELDTGFFLYAADKVK